MAGGDSIVGFGSVDAWTRAIALITGAIKRRRTSVALITLLFAGVGGAAAVLLPRAYVTEASLLVTKQYVMPALANPKRAIPSGSEVSLQSAAETVLSRSSLEGIARALDLLGRWERERSAVLRLKDRVVERVAGPISEADKTDALVSLLAKRISVTVSNDVVTVKATWTDRQGALDIVNRAVDAFLDTRRKVDVDAVAEAYRILERTADVKRQQVDLGVAAIAGAERAPAPSPAPGGSVAGPRMRRDDGLGDLRDKVLAARRARVEIGARRQARLAEVEARLAELRGSQTERHPDMVALRRDLERLSEEPEELREARDRESRLLAEYVARGGRPEGLARAEIEADREPEQSAAARRLEPSVPAARPKADEEDAAVIYARARFQGSLESYQELVARLGDVQIELDTAKAAFAYRYSVTQPARLPKSANSPNAPLIVIGALLAGLSAGVLRAVFVELRAMSLLSPAALTRHLALQPSPRVTHEGEAELSA